MNRKILYQRHFQRYSRARHTYEVSGQEFKGLILKDGSEIDAGTALSDRDGKLGAAGIKLTRIIVKTGPFSQESTTTLEITSPDVFPLQIIWYDSDYLTGGHGYGTTGGSEKKTATLEFKNGRVTVKNDKEKDA